MFDGSPPHSCHQWPGSITYSGDSRRKEFEEALELIKEKFPGIESLRDISLPMLNSIKGALAPSTYKHCQFAVKEMIRAEKACIDFEKDDMPAVGKKMFEAHQSLQKEFEVSCTEIDFLVEFARKHKGVSGARLMGKGYGGCTLNLVKQTAVEEFTQAVYEAYKNQFGISMSVYPVRIVNGVSIIAR